MANYSYYYPGGTYDLDPNQGFIGYRLPLSKIGTSIRPDTAAQVVEVTNLLNQGFKQLEAGAISTKVLDEIPKQHFDEIRRIAKLTDAKVSLHAPIQDIEASGIQEGRYVELNREISERKLQEVIDKAHILSPDVGIPITIHSANMAGTEFVPGDKTKGEARFKEYQIVAINQETGEVKNVFKEEERAFPSDIAISGEPKIVSPKKRLEMVNDSQWINAINQLFEHQKHADEVLGNSLIKMANAIQIEEQGIPIEKSGINLNELGQSLNQLKKADVFLNNLQSSFSNQFEQAYKYSDDEGRKKLKEIAEDWYSGLQSIGNEAVKNGYGRFVKDDKGGVHIVPVPEKQLTFMVGEVSKKQQILNNALNKLNDLNVPSPQVYKKVEDFAMEKSATTFSNVAMHSYEKYGKKDISKAPIVSIENLYTGMAYSNPEDFKKLVDMSREKFKDTLIKKDKISEKQAEKIANQIIGVTWDVGHLNMLRKQGFEEKDLVEATKLVGKDIKHIHFTDNFGYGDSHLAPGMGNVPFKKHLEELEKAGALKKDTMIINEVGGFVNQFRQSPFPYMLESFGSPMIATGEGPYWNQTINTSGAYMQFPSAILPEQHFSMYGSGFSSLPRELGGQVGGSNSRFSGTPNA
jgi:hypothetical protein